MPIQQLQLICSAENAEALSDFLDLCGAHAVTFEDAADDAIFEPELNSTPLWQHTKIKALFDSSFDLKRISNLLLEKFGSIIESNISFETLPDKAWEREWLKEFKPQCFGGKLWVVPSQFSSEFKPHGRDAIYRVSVGESHKQHRSKSNCEEFISLTLDPGLAFGTGTHPTTALCLEWLAKHPPQEKIIIDYGCGSGILAIAAMKLGAKKVYAIDHDPQALEATQSNAEKNQISLEIISSENIPQEMKADLLIANILAKPLIELAPHFKKMLTKNGQLVLSGILDSQIEAIENAYQHIIHFSEKQHQEEWALLAGFLSSSKPTSQINSYIPTLRQKI